MADPKENEDAQEVETEEETAGGESEEEAGGEEEAEGGAESEGEEESSEAEGGSAAAGAGTGAASQSRRDKRIAALAAQRNEEREKRIRAETLAEERGNRPQQTQDPAAAARAREEKLALMTPEERKDYLNDEKINGMQQQVLLTQLQTKDMLDKAEYQRNAKTDKVYAKHAAEVERRLHAARQRGIDYAREDILDKIIGEEVRKVKPDAKKQAAARERVESASGKPLSARSNPAPQRRSGGKESLAEIEARIGDVEFPNDMRFG